MSHTRPELVFVKGPQRGKRIRIRQSPSIAGRSSDVEIPLKEDYVSRQQMKFTQSPEGWIVENLSVNGTMVNGRRYKAGKEILLGTGDVLGVGLKTEMLFVAPGDDVEAAVLAYQQGVKGAPVAMQAPQTAGDDSAAAAGQPQPAQPAGAAPLPANVPAAAARKGAPATKPLGEEEDAQAAAASQRRKMLMGIVVGVMLLAVVGIYIVSQYRSKTSNPNAVVRSGPPRLTTGDGSSNDNSQIATALKSRPQMKRDDTAAEDALARAKDYFSRRSSLPENIYLAVKYFNLYMAYADTSILPNTNDQSMYYEALYGPSGKDGLIADVSREYDDAYLLETQGRWKEALMHLQRIQQMLKDDAPGGVDPADPVYAQLLSNVLAHVTLVKGKLTKG